MNIRPLLDRVVVKRLEDEKVSKGGIIIPDNAQEKGTLADVVAVGNGKVLPDGTLRPLDVKVGDRITFGKWQGTEITVEGEKLLVMREEDILGVIES